MTDQTERPLDRDVGDLPDITGYPLDRALSLLARSGIDSPQIIWTRGRREPDIGIARVLRVEDGGHIVRVALFPHALTEAETIE